MLGTGLSILAALAVLGSLLRQEDLSYGLVTLSIIGLAWLVDLLGERWSRSRLSALVGGALAVLMVVTVQLSGLGWGPCLVGVALVLLALVAARGHRGTLHAVVVGAVPATGLILALLLHQAPGGSWVPLRIMLWSLAAWPTVALLNSGRRWMAISAIGVAGLLYAIHRILAQAGGGDGVALDTVSLQARRLEGLLAIGQTLLVVACIAPHLSLSDIRWRWTALAGLLGILGPLALVVATGPWPGGWPALTWWVMLPASAVLVTGIIGMLCTVRQAEAMAEHAVRALALGMGATASLTLPLLGTALPPSELYLALAAASAPLIWGLVLALLLAMTGLVARRRDAPLHTTTLLRMKIRPRLRHSMLDFARGLGQDFRHEARSWATPRGMVPLIVLAATWPAFSSLGPRTSLVPLLVLLSVAGSGFARRSLPLWTLFQSSLMALTAWLLGLPGPIMIAAAALGLVAAYPFLRWRVLHPGWSFSAGLLLQVALWGFLCGPDHQLMAAALAFGIAVLLNNALVPSGARGILLVISALWLLVFLAHWIPAHDPYFPLLLRDRDLVIEVGHLLLRLPILALILMVLWVSRHRLACPGWRAPPWQRFLLGTAGILAASLWAGGFADRPAVGIAAWAVLLAAIRPLLRELSDAQLLDERDLLVDATSLVIAVLVIAAGRGAALVDAHGGGVAIEPGALGLVLIDTIRDLLALALAVAIPVLCSVASSRSHLAVHGRSVLHTARIAGRRLGSSARLTRR